MTAHPPPPQAWTTIPQWRQHTDVDGSLTRCRHHTSAELVSHAGAGFSAPHASAAYDALHAARKPTIAGSDPQSQGSRVGTGGWTGFSKLVQDRPEETRVDLQMCKRISTVGCNSNESTSTAFLVCREAFADDDASPQEYSHSSRPTSLQCYVYRPISYPDHMSADALSVANSIMLRLTIPGNINYKVVQYNSRWYHQGCRFGFTAFSMCLGSSYFQRLVAGMPHLEYAVRRSGPVYADYLECMPPCSERRWAALHAQYGSQYGSSSQVTEESTLASIQFTCVYIACKLVDRMPMLEMLRYILTHLYGSMVSKAQTYDVEAKCLEGLGFRLGPYFLADELDDDWPF